MSSDSKLQPLLEHQMQIPWDLIGRIEKGPAPYPLTLDFSCSSWLAAHIVRFISTVTVIAMFSVKAPSGQRELLVALRLFCLICAPCKVASGSSLFKEHTEREKLYETVLSTLISHLLTPRTEL